MKSRKLDLSAHYEDIRIALDETDRFCLKAGLNMDDSLKLRLLTEEMIATSTDLLDKASVQLWLESESGDVKIHITATEAITPDAQKELLALAKNSVNTPVKGLRGMISSVFAQCVCALDKVKPAHEFSYLAMEGPLIADFYENAEWRLSNQRIREPEEFEELDGVERMLIERFADDVIVTVNSCRAELTAKKHFAQLEHKG